MRTRRAVLLFRLTRHVLNGAAVLTHELQPRVCAATRAARTPGALALPTPPVAHRLCWRRLRCGRIPCWHRLRRWGRRWGWSTHWRNVGRRQQQGAPRDKRTHAGRQRAPARFVAFLLGAVL